MLGLSLWSTATDSGRSATLETRMQDVEDKELPQLLHDSLSHRSGVHRRARRTPTLMLKIG